MEAAELEDGSIPDLRMLESTMPEGDGAEVEEFGHRVDEMFIKVDTLAERLSEVEQFYSAASRKQLNTSKGSSVVKDKDKEKQIASFKKRQQDASRREAAAAKRMQELMRQFGAILRQITQHKWAGPFMQPVDVVGLGLHDYYEVIDKPMDFSTIKNKMEAKDGSGYKSVREICADVRLIFKNAMKYNDERDDVHVMAKTLLAKFEEKWLQLLPKVDEEDKRRKEEEAEAQLGMQLAQEAAHSKMARDLSIELEEADMHLEELREMVLQKCRYAAYDTNLGLYCDTRCALAWALLLHLGMNTSISLADLVLNKQACPFARAWKKLILGKYLRRISTDEKKAIMKVLTSLSPEDLSKALLIIAQNNPNFQAAATEVDLDLDAQNESTLWKLKFFVKDILQVQGKSSTSIDGNNVNNINNNSNQNNNNKRKREICEALAKTSQKKNKKP